MPALNFAYAGTGDSADIDGARLEDIQIAEVVRSPEVYRQTAVAGEVEVA